MFGPRMPPPLRKELVDIQTLTMGISLDDWASRNPYRLPCGGRDRCPRPRRRRMIVGDLQCPSVLNIALVQRLDIARQELPYTIFMLTRYRISSCTVIARRAQD